MQSSPSARACVITVLIAGTAWGGVAAQQTPRDGTPAPLDRAVAASPDDVGAEWTRWSHGRYRITPGDVLEITFTFVPELNQTVSVQPDGYLTLRDIRDLRAQGRTVAQLEADLQAAYGAFVRDPALSVTLKEFEEPYFIAGGEVQRPGRYDLRGALTLTQAVAIAGGFTQVADRAGVVLYRHFGADDIDASKVNVKRMYARRDLNEDPLLRPGDTIVVPTSLLGKLTPLTPFLNLWWWLW